MHALTFHGKEVIRHESVPDAVIVDPADVVVKVNVAAICGSDLHPYHEREKGLQHGTVMGHEFVGEIVDVGRDVNVFRIGDLVFCPFSTNCGECFYCRRGLTGRCVAGQLFGWRENGHGLHGGQAEYVRVPMAASTLRQLPEGMSPDEGLLLGDILSTGYFCARNAEVSPEGVYAVVGCGPVGLMAVVGALELGAQQIYAIDSIPTRLKIAERFGAVAVDFTKENVIERLKEATDGRGVDAVLEVVGNAAAGRTAFDLLRPGGIISTVGVPSAEVLDFSPVEAYDKNITYKNGRCPARYYMERLIPVVQSRKYDLCSIISHRLPLAQGANAYKMFDEKLDNCTKVVFEL